jgi:LlaJI restriction endonuclease
MPSRLSVVVAGDSKEEVTRRFGPEAWHLLADNGFVNRTTIGGVGFCRDLQKHSLFSVLPKAFGLVPDRARLSSVQVLRENVFRLIRVFNKICREGGFGLKLIETNRTSFDLQDRSDPVLDSLEAALKLRKDFFLHGLYMRKKALHIETSPSHPIHWPRTIKKFPPMMEDDSIFFSKTVHRARRRDLTHSLTTLQCRCLDEILDLTGEGHLLAGSRIAYPKASPSLARTATPILRRLNSEIFDERGRALLKTISAYLQVGRLRSSDQTERDQVLAYTADFERIWEFMLRRLFGQGGRSRKVPAGKWHPFPSADATEGIAPEVDVFTEVSGIPVILDAKDYRILCPTGERFGRASDHYKQVIYGALIGADSKRPEPTNILLFPGIDQRNLFQINGCHQWKTLPKSLVFEVTVDYSMAVQAWLGERDIRP